MGRLLDVALMPHPPIMVPEVGGRELEKISATVTAARELAARVAAHRPEVIIIISPHGPVFRDAVGIWAVKELKGDLGAFRAGEVRFTYSLDLDLSQAIAAGARAAGVPVAWLDDATCQSYGLTPELDHGMMVPLYFLRQAGLETPLVAMGMAFLERQKLYAFGAALARALEDSPRRALLVASGDMSHRLLPGAPAGYDPRGKDFDTRLRELLASLDVEGILNIPEELSARAGECGLRSFIMGLGALDGHKVRGEVLSYEGPFGVGYLVAHLEPSGRDPATSLLAGKGKASGQTGKSGKAGRSGKTGENGATGAVREAQKAGESLPVRLASQSLEHYLHTGRVLPVPDPLPPGLAGRAGAFVSLKKHGNLRGCIGTIGPTRENLAQEIIYNALAAGLDDPRFPPVTVDELPELQYSVDVLGEPEPTTLAGLDPKVYGVIVSHGRRRGLLLPDLGGVDTVEEQVAIARQKGGIGPDEPYRLERFKVTRYH
ncbi:MAG: hypothetical protein PWQ18_64 [Clostridia bacterium]|nr:hypothetical protein [Clostridia bacterium]